ncbi:MAG: aminoglycoside phosphotransferase family protein [Desulfobacterales bacterium]|nr:aminoglycoside phosphotransferase family protein [Pseudomonadota bacterium]MBU4354959.1 aminoglycoside phosphotransferase family protein [Pseudomonadota bacterium]MCG2771726.1 aminoglycoside phosphotransferase family protein [Desulfobacterales bacterium]
MNRLADADPLARALRRLVGAEAGFRPPAGEVRVESLPASRQVLRFTFPAGDYAVVGKFFSAYPPQASADLSLAREYDHYLRLPGLGLGNGGGLAPRLLGRWPERSLGLLLEAVPGPDLDYLLLQASVHGDPAPLFRALDKLAHLLAFFHSRPVPALLVTPEPALAYLDKVMAQLLEAGPLTREDWQALAHERDAWEERCQDFSDRQVLIHGDATPTNFLFPNGRAVALDLERLRIGDRLWDLSWVAGELKHAWGWRTADFSGSEAAIRHFFRMYLTAAGLAPALTRRLFSLNPFYMALAELRIARNLYLTRDYRRQLVAEARRCLAHGRQR